MYVADRAGGVPPYLISTCTCRWIGTAVDIGAAEPVQAYEAVVHEARAHTTDVDLIATWPIDGPPEQWRRVFAPDVAVGDRRRSRSIWGDLRETGPLLLVALSILGLLLLWLVRGPELMDLAASRWGPRARMLPLAVAIAVPLLAVTSFTYLIYAGRYRAPRVYPVTPSPKWWERLTDGRYATAISAWLGRPNIARVWAPATMLFLAWFAALIVVDLTDTPVTVEGPVRIYCSGRYREHVFAMGSRTFALAWGSDMPCVLPQGRYRLTLAAATNFVIAYARLP